MHRIVMAAFVGICPEGYQVNHIDGNKGNNHISNLEYVTSKENVLHAYKNGLRKSGQDSPLATITNEIAIKIRNEYKRYVVTSVMLAKKYNTTPAVVKTVVGGNKWKYIK